MAKKKIAEPEMSPEEISARCREAWARWVEKGGEPEPKTRDAILSQNMPTGVPLSAFASLHRVSVDAVLAEMGVE